MGRIPKYYWDDEISRHVLLEDIHYYSRRYKKKVFVPAGYTSDGATGAMDIRSMAWWVHDHLCDTGRFAGGDKCTNLQASMILADILWSEKRYFRALYWMPATFLFGGGEARRNGLI